MLVILSSELWKTCPNHRRRLVSTIFSIVSGTPSNLRFASLLILIFLAQTTLIKSVGFDLFRITCLPLLKDISTYQKYNQAKRINLAFWIIPNMSQNRVKRVIK